jgi:hypothetical protein
MTIETIGRQASSRGTIDGVGKGRKVLIEVSIGLAECGTPDTLGISAGYEGKALQQSESRFPCKAGVLESTSKR